MSVEPRKAVTCIIARPDADGKVLLARRNPSLRFMGGHHVFPGGRISDDESTAQVVGARDDAHARALHAAAREVFEETGLLCVRGNLPECAVRDAARNRVLEDESTFDGFLSEHGLTIHAEDFAPAGAWITPNFSPIRFDTQYYLFRVQDAQECSLIEGEIVGLDWMSAAEARRRWHMGDIHVSTPVAYALQQLAAKPLDEALDLLQRRTERSPGEHNRFEIRRGITLVPLTTRTIPPATHTNCIIVGETELYVIDPGSEDPEELEHLANQLDHFVELGAEIRAVVLTHSHPDHIAGVPFVRDRYGAPVWAHAAVREVVDFPVERDIADGDVLESAGDPPWRLRAICTPGHDPGHLAFVEESTRALIAGDLIANPGTIVVSRQYGGDMGQFIASLERVMEEDTQLIIPSHGRPEGRPREVLAKHRDHRLWRERKIADAYAAGFESMDDLLAKAYDDAPAAALPLARHALEAHLIHLGLPVPK